MSAATTHAKVSYFGKIPSRGDFIKTTGNLSLTTQLDNWLAQTMELLAADPRWKIIYDAARPMDFAFMGPKSRHAIAGHWIASKDEAQRRFPFLSMSVLDLEAPYEFVTSSPIVLARLWNKLSTLTNNVLQATDPATPLQALTGAAIELEVGTAGYDAVFADFLDLQTVASLDNKLASGGFEGSTRHVLLALGLLLQPVMSSSTSRLEKSLVLPLPTDPMDRYLVATFWMQLISPFLKRADFELAVFITHLNDKPSMVIGFSGASARTLQAIIDPHVAQDHHIAFDNAEWVEEQLDSDYGIRKLSTYLEQPGLSLSSAHKLFCNAFTGA